ncbi:MAG: IPTL-CTERM sorting domain-containing protein [Thiolinea sp.]
MKKTIAYAVSNGLMLIALSQTAAAEGVEYRIGWDSANGLYRVYMRPDVTPSPDRTLSAQVTLRIPTGTLPQNFSDASIGLTSVHAPGAVWSASSKVFAPTEDNSVDYISFTPTLTDQTAFSLQGGQEQEIFSFHTNDICLGVVEIMDNDTDPFNNPPSGQLNSEQTNPGNEFSSLVWSGANDYLGIAGTAADCKAGTGNTDPVANNDSATVVEGGTINIDVLGNDTDADNDNLTITAKTNGANGGTVTLVNDSSVTYTPAAGFVGTDSFTYTITDGEGGSSTATVTVTVTAKQPANNAPVAVADTATVQAGGSVAIDVLANDTDADGDTLSLDSVADPANGTVTLQNGNVLYVPDTGFSGTDTFSYTVSDGKDPVSGSVTVTVTSPNDNDGDGISNADEAILGTDPDNPDTDGDGIGDGIEVGDVSAPVDTDRDGTIDALDEDDDNDTILTVYENYNGGSPRDDDTDRDGTPDYLDPDDDNDGLMTAQESPDGNPPDGNPVDALDTDGNGVPDYLQRPGNVAPTTKAAIPTLSQWAQILLSMLLGVIALRTYFSKNRL